MAIVEFGEQQRRDLLTRRRRCLGCGSRAWWLRPLQPGQRQLSRPDVNRLCPHRGGRNSSRQRQQQRSPGPTDHLGSPYCAGAYYKAVAESRTIARDCTVFLVRVSEPARANCRGNGVRPREASDPYSGGSTSTVPGGGSGGASFLNTATPSRPPNMPKIVPVISMKTNLNTRPMAPRPPELARSIMSRVSAGISGC